METYCGYVKVFFEPKGEPKGVQSIQGRGYFSSPLELGISPYHL